MEHKFIIYGLRDPRTDEIRYVGKSARGMDRPMEHFPPPKVDTTYKAHWLRKLLVLGLAPEIVVLEQCAVSNDLSSREQYWIAIGRAALGKRFTNATAGGEGCLDPTPETRAKMSAAISATKNRPEVMAHIKVTTKEIANRPDVSVKKSVGMKAAWKIPGYAESHNASLKVAMNRPDVKVKRSEAAKAAHARPEAKERHRAAITAAAARPEVVKKRSASATVALNRPDVKDKLRVAIRNSLSNPEVKAKIAAKSRAMWERRKAGGGVAVFEYNGETLTIRQWAARLGLSRAAVKSRLRNGRTIAEIVQAATP